MKKKTLLILGGYGVTGTMIARLLVQETGADLVLAGRNESRACETARGINELFSCARVRGVFADASDRGSLVRAFKGVDMVVVASSTSKNVINVAEAAMEAGADYFDIQYSAEKYAALRSLEDGINRSERIFITDGGFHPGLPAAMVRHLAPRFDVLKSANCGSVISINWASFETTDATIKELLEEFRRYDARYYSGGAWKKMKMTSGAGMIKMDFGSGFEKRSCAPMYLEEMGALPGAYPGLRETGFFVGGFNPVTDYVIIPLVMVMMAAGPRLFAKPAAAILSWGLKRFSRPPFVTMLKLEARGVKDGLPLAMDLVISHDDGYMLTAISAAACLAQYIDGAINRSGLHCQALCVDTVRFMKDIERMGAVCSSFSDVENPEIYKTDPF